MGYFKRNRPPLFDTGLSELGGIPVPTATPPATTNVTMYFVDSAASGSSHGTLQIGGSPPSHATMGTGAVLGTTHAANEFADMAYGSIQPATAFTTTTGPSAATGTTKCFRSSTTISGSFAQGNWKIALGVIMTSAASSGSAAVRVRFYRGTSATGSGAQEITQATQASGNANIALTAQQNLSVLFNANAITLEAEYLFIAIGFEILSGAVSSTGNTIAIVQDSANSAVTTPAFTSSAPTLYLLGTSQGTTGNPLGPDNSCDQVLAGGVWGQILPEATTNNNSDASACVDPATGIFYLFGNFDGANPATSYNPQTHVYTTLGNLPSNCWGGGGAAILNGIAYMVGGFITGTGAGSTEVYSYNIAGASYSTAFTPLATGVIDCPAVVSGSLIYHGGGDLGDGDGTPVTSWFSWDPITDTRTSLAALPIALGGMAIAALNGFIYIFGGYTTGSTNYQGVKNVYRYSIAGNSWTTMNPLPVAVNYARACVWNGQIWMAGGITSAGFGAYTTATWTYNVALDSWNYQGPLSTPIFGSVLGFSPPSSTTPTVVLSGIEAIEAFGAFLGSLIASAAGIVPSEVIGAPNLAGSVTTVGPAGIPSTEALGAFTTMASASPSGIGPSEVPGAPALAGAFAPAGVTPSEIAGAPTMVGRLSPAGVTPGEVPGAPTVTPTVTAAVILPSEAVGSPAGAPVAAPAGVGPVEAFGALQAFGVIAVTPSGIPSLEAVGAGSVAGKFAPSGIVPSEVGSSPIVAVVFAPAGVAAADVFGALQAFGVFAVAPSGIPSGEAIGAGSVSGRVAPSGVAPSEATSAPTGAPIASPAGAAPSEVFGAFTSLGTFTVSPGGIASPEAVGAGSVAARFAPSGVAPSEASSAPAVVPIVGPSGIAPSDVPGAPTVFGIVTVSPSGIASFESVGAGVLAGLLAPAGIEPSELPGAPILLLTFAPSGIDATEAPGAPQLVAVITGHAFPSGIEALEAFGAGMLKGGTVFIVVLPRTSVLDATLAASFVEVTTLAPTTVINATLASSVA